MAKEVTVDITGADIEQMLEEKLLALVEEATMQGFAAGLAAAAEVLDHDRFDLFVKVADLLIGDAVEAGDMETAAHWREARAEAIELQKAA